MATAKPRSKTAPASERITPYIAEHADWRAKHERAHDGVERARGKGESIRRGGRELHVRASLRAELGLEPPVHVSIGLGEHELRHGSWVVSEVRPGASAHLEDVTREVAEQLGAPRLEAGLLDRGHEAIVDGRHEPGHAAEA
jgi:hypothetical protein